MYVKRDFALYFHPPFKLLKIALASFMFMPFSSAICSGVAALILLTEPNCFKSACFLDGPTPRILSSSDFIVRLLRTLRL